MAAVKYTVALAAVHSLFICSHCVCGFSAGNTTIIITDCKRTHDIVRKRHTKQTAATRLKVTNQLSLLQQDGCLTRKDTMNHITKQELTQTLAHNRSSNNKITTAKSPSLKRNLVHDCLCFIELINELPKRDKMRGLPSILSLFRNAFINSIPQEHKC